MTTLLWQTALLLLGAYFLGAWVACIVRRVIHVSSAETLPSVGLQTVPAAVVPASPPPRLADLEPIKPKIEPVGKSASAPQADAAAPRATIAARPVPVAPAPVAPIKAPSAPAAAAPAPVAPVPAAAAPAAPPLAARPTAPTPPPVILPAAGGTTTGQSSTSAPMARPVPQAVSASPPDDLTYIKSIDTVVQAELRQRGVHRFADIAAWRSQDVERISTALGFSGRIERENWIEQAQILASGGQTAYSERVARGERPVAAPSPDEGKPSAAVPSKAAEATPPAARPAAAALAAAAAASIAAASPRRPAVMGLGRDNLQRISQISAEVEKLLNVQGVSRYDQIASWPAADVAKFDRLLGNEGRIARENWIEQAQILAKGGETAFSRDFDQKAENSKEPLRPARLAEAIQASIKADAAATKADGDGAARRPDVGALRSVRSEAFRGDVASPTGRVPGSSSSDDLKRIRGVGVLIEKRLNALGIWTYEQIANWTNADIDRVSRVLDFKGRIERESWVEQARILASGGQTEFARRVERGEVETSRNKP